MHLISLKLLFHPHLFLLLSQVKTGRSMDNAQSRLMVVLFGTLILIQQLTHVAIQLVKTTTKKLTLILYYAEVKKLKIGKKFQITLFLIIYASKISKTIMIQQVQYYGLYKLIQMLILDTGLNQLMQVSWLVVLKFYMLIMLPLHGLCKFSEERMVLMR